ncbi:MAG TPA: DUF2167 domain-containing protein [Polyangiaceae bacterium]|nr:DUF2167 domain-containing protein [Polyangiaceae bacterium]
MAKSVWALGVACALSFAVAPVAHAEKAEAAAPADSAAAAGNEAPAEGGQRLPWQPGPKPLDLGHGIKLDLPEGFAFLGKPEAGQLMEKMGNLHNEDMLGLVVSQDETAEFVVTIDYEDTGHIKDDEELDAKELLESIQEGEDDYNAERKKLGFSAIHAAGWDESPHYDKQQHQLIWGLIVESPEGGSINYNTRILGRTGFVSLNLLTDKQHLAQYKPAGALLLSKTRFEDGKRYSDFNASTDKVAEYGLTGLVLGGAGLGLAKAAKIGLLAKFGKVLIGLLIAGKKVIVVGVLALGAALRSLFKKKDATA